MTNSSLIPHPFHHAFTLVELLVVIAIIGILSGVIMASFGSGTESGRAARCLTNMKNLANACQTYGMDSGYYPLAGSVEYFTSDGSLGRNNARLSYRERPGWISWSMATYPSTGPQTPSSIGMCSDNENERLYAITNGCLWNLTSHNHETYICPSHTQALGKDGRRPNWSYLMNAYFDWSGASGGGTRASGSVGRPYGNLPRADRFLLFSEVPFAGLGSWFPEGTSSDTDSDAILQFSAIGDEGGKYGNGSENIGFCHRRGKNWIAHVAFADGHCEKLVAPASGLSESALKELTSWLCLGHDVGFDGKKYQKLD